MSSTDDHPEVTVAAKEYDTTRALFDGSVALPAGAALSTADFVPDVFRMLLDGRAQIGELGLTFLLRTLEAGADLVALPVFPNRVFRHSCIFVRRGGGVRTPADLVGRTVGEFGIYGQDSGVWAKGVLGDDHGWRPEQSRWVIGGLDRPSPPFDFVPRTAPDGLDIRDAPSDASLVDLLRAGEVDAIVSANVPQAFLDGEPWITRLFEDYEERERDWFRRTGLFPIMHAVVAHRSVLEQHPGLARRTYDAFLAAKDAAAAAYREQNRLFEVHTMLPWTNALYERDVALMGDDWWPYGIGANRSAIEANLRYQHEQGITRRRWDLEEVFLSELLDT